VRFHKRVDLPHTPLRSGNYYFLPNSQTTTTAAPANDDLRTVPFYVGQRVRITVLGGEVTTVGENGSKVRLGIYRDDGAGEPGELVVDAGTIDGDSATVQEIGGLDVRLAPGWYHVAACVQSAPNTAPVMRVMAAGHASSLVHMGTLLPGVGTAIGHSMAGVSGALPTTFMRSNRVWTNTMPRVFAKIELP
jgi:hypothetical protein